MRKSVYRTSSTNAIIRRVAFVSFVAMLVVLTVLPGVSAAQDVLERIQESGVLRVGLEGSYPPYSFVDDHGDLVGFDVDISKEIAQRLGVRSEFTMIDWADIIAGLQDDGYDAIIAQMTITEERQQIVDFTDPYVITGMALISRSDDDRFSHVEDVKGHTVGVMQGTTFEFVALTIENANLKTYGQFWSTVDELIAGNVDVIIDDPLTVAYLIKSERLPIKITSPIFTEQQIAIAVKKGNQDLVDELNRILDEMRADGTYQAIFTKWFGELTLP